MASKAAKIFVFIETEEEALITSWGVIRSEGAEEEAVLSVSSVAGSRLN
jgi:hypothetical protein